MLFGIHNDNKLYRLTFSYSLCKEILKSYPHYKISKFEFTQLGELKDGEVPENGLYGITSTKNNLLLRIAMSKEIASLYTEDSSRFIERVEIRRVPSFTIYQLGI